MNQWMMMPLLIPAIVSALIVVTARFDQVLARVFCMVATILMLAVDIKLMSLAEQGITITYSLGNWPPPMAISLALDRFTALMLVLSGVIGVLMSLAAMDGQDNRGRHFHSLLLLQLMGVHGAFMTHDLFNLFVFFEVMLGASYGLMVYGGGKRRLQAGIQFVVINLLGSTLFLVAVGLIYSVTGALDLLDLRTRLGSLATGDRAIANVGLVLLFAVFSIKAAVVPFHFWLPTAYSNTGPIVAGLFALSTKVGIYATIRVFYSLIAGQEHLFSSWVTAWLMPASLITVTLGMMGVLGSRTLGQMASYASLASSGAIMISVGLFNAPATIAGIYYLVHSTFAGALIFLIVEVVARSRPSLTDRLRVGPKIRQAGFVASLFVVGGIGLVGLPPLSGFLGKLLIIQNSGGGQVSIWVGGVLLVTSLFGMMGFARAGSTLFWKSSSHPIDGPVLHRRPVILTLTAAGILVMFIIALTFYTDPVLRYVEQLVQQLGPEEIAKP